MTSDLGFMLMLVPWLVMFLIQVLFYFVATKKGRERDRKDGGDKF